MNIFLKPTVRHQQGFAFLLVLIMIGVSLLLLAGAVNRSSSVAINNQRNNEFTECCNVAEAADEKAFAMLAWEFQGYGVAGASSSLSIIRTNVPSAKEYAYWANYVFSDASGHDGQTYVNYAYTYTGYLPSAYGGLFTDNAPVYRIVSNVRKANSATGVIGTAQEDVLLALVPLTTWAIFYNGKLEFTQCAPMTVNGRVHANGNIYVGTSSSLKFFDGVDCTGTLTSPVADGIGPWTSKNWNTSFDNNPSYVTNVPSISTTLGTADSHFIIDIPPTGEDPMSTIGQQRLYNKAQMVLIVTNGTGVGRGTNPTVILTLQAPLNGNVPGNDSAKDIWVLTNATAANLSTNMPFLDLDNSFYDQRERKTNIITDIDVGSLANWMTTNSRVQGKLPSNAGLYPTVLYVADRRKATVSIPGQLAVVRLNDGKQLPANNNYGFSVATQNPLYVDGNYNTQIAGSGGSSAGTDDTTYTVPAALLSDSLTILSAHWSDAVSKTSSQKYAEKNSSWAATDNDTINAAIITGTMPSTDSTATGFSGGVHNLPRMLEDWATSSKDLWLNTSILRLWDSQMATNQFRNPDGFTPTPVNPYYNPPTRHFAFDQNFLDPAKVPPGIPIALVPIRFGWGIPPPGSTTSASN